MNNFVGREDELSCLSDLLAHQQACLVIVKGRRRIGKSTLIEEFGKNKTLYRFSGLPPSEATTDQSQKEEFARQLNRELGLRGLKAEDWGDLFLHLANATRTGRILILLDEISWMGNNDPHFLGKLKIAWDLYFKKNSKLILFLCGSVSSWIEKNILSSTGFLGRETLTLHLKELPLIDCQQFWLTKKKLTSTYDMLKTLSVTGGVPRYLELINPKLSAEENIRKLCFTSNAVLVNEFEKIFSDLFNTRNVIYQKITTTLINGSQSQEAIMQALKIEKGGTISDYLNDLVQAGFISRDFTWSLKNGQLSKLSQYRLSDNYSRFYLKYIAPNRHKIELGHFNQLSLSTLSAWNSMMGLQIENLILNNRHLIKKALNIPLEEVVCDNPYFQRKTIRQPGCQIDYLIQTRYNALYVCEIKFSKKPLTSSVINEMVEKLNRFRIPKHFYCRPVLIHVNGVSDEVIDSNYFSNIIDMAIFFKSNNRINR